MESTEHKFDRMTSMGMEPHRIRMVAVGRADWELAAYAKEREPKRRIPSARKTVPKRKRKERK